MAEIYLASAVGAEGFAKDVVIKVVHSFLGNDPQFIEMFIAEAKLASRLNHANVVQIFDFGKHADRHFLVMEYVRGVSLAMLGKRCRELGLAVPATLAAEVCAHVARGLHYAHTLSDRGRSLGVVHRDVTPHNVLLSFDGAVKISDFGIAKATTTNTAPGMLKGKFAYMSPEQSRGEPVDARSDVFSLGIVLWELLTGGRLFSGDSDVSVLRAVQSGAITPPMDLGPGVDREVSDVVMKALSRRLEERFQSAFDFERALATFVIHSAKVVEDTSVSDFLHQVFPGEFEHRGSMEPPLEPQPIDDSNAFGDTDFVERRGPPPGTVTYTPAGAIPVRATRGPGELARVESTEEHPALSHSARRTAPVASEDGAQEPEVARRGTEPVRAPPRVSTTRMPRHASSSQRLVRRPPAKPAVVEGATGAPDAGGYDSDGERLAVEEDVRAARLRRPILPYVVGGVVVLTIAAGAVAAVLWPAGVGSAPSPAPVAQLDDAPLKRAPLRHDAERAHPVEEPPQPPAEVAAAPAILPVPKASPEPAVAPVPVLRMGRLTVKVIPFAIVSANGRQLGEAYASGTYQLKPGTYEIEMTHPKKRVRTTVTIRPSEEVRLVFNALE